MDFFVNHLSSLKEQILGLIEIEILCGDKCFAFKALNEFIIQDENDKT